LGRGLIRTSLLIACFAAAAAAGYLATAQFGAEALRREAEDQLTTLLRGEVRIARARLVIRGGLFIEAERVGVYPRETIPHRPAVFASFVSAELDVFALLTGRFRLSRLTVDEVVIEVERDAEGVWGPTPFRLLQERRRRDMPDDMERRLGLVNAIEKISRFLLERPIIARQIVLHRGRIRFVDSRAPDAQGRDNVLELSGIEGRLQHHWLSGEADLDITATLSSRNERSIPLRVDGRQRRANELHLGLTVDELPLEIFERYIASERYDFKLRGILSGRIAYDTRTHGNGTLLFNGSAQDLGATIPLGDDAIYIDQRLSHLSSTIQLHPGRARLTEARLETPSTVALLSGTMERPLRLSSQTRFEIDIEGLGLDEVRSIAKALPGRDARTLENLLKQVHSGRVDRIGGSGSARFVDWRRLFRRELSSLPGGFVLRAKLAGIRVDAGGRGWVNRLGANVELAGDRLALRGTRAYWNDRPLPMLNLTVSGISNIVKASGSRPGLSSPPPALHGVSPLIKFLSGGPGDEQGDEQKEESEEVAAPASEEPADPTVNPDSGRSTRQASDSSPGRPVRLRIESLDHPALGWPVQDARVTVRTADNGMEIEIHEALWAGTEARGEAIWVNSPREVLNVNLRISRADRAPSASSNLSSEPTSDRLWAVGRFELDTAKIGRIPLELVHGRFALRGASLELSKIRADSKPIGKLVASTTLDLALRDRVPMLFNISLVGADMAATGEAFGFPRDFATGRVQLTGSFEADMKPGTRFLESLRGRLEMDARDGEIYRTLPFMVALAHATEGFDVNAGREALVYESATALLGFDRGLITTNNFRLEGPMRVQASVKVEAATPPHAIEGTLGVFLFRGAGILMETLPLVKVILPGSEKGLVGAYFNLSGVVGDPVLVALPGKSLAEDLPGVLSAPLKILQALLGEGDTPSIPDPPMPSSRPSNEPVDDPSKDPLLPPADSPSSPAPTPAPPAA